MAAIVAIHSHQDTMSGRRRTTRRKLKGIVKLAYVFVAAVFFLLAMSYWKILSNTNTNTSSVHLSLLAGTNTNTNTNKTINNVGGGEEASQHSFEPPRLQRQHHRPTTKIITNTDGEGGEVDGGSSSSCAILLFGLPRAFKEYVLPSLEKNVIRPNAKYGCDYFVHFYKQASEGSGRSGRGGTINPDDIFLLRTAVQNVHNHSQSQSQNNLSQQQLHVLQPRVSFVSDTNETFWKRREAEIMKYRNTKNDDGKYTYFPYSEMTYEYPGTLDNIVKQWHSVNAAWDAMEKVNKKSNNNNNDNKYRRVAMMRNDVVYITPIDIYDVPVPPFTLNRHISDYTNNSVSVIPKFAKYPVNDRMIYGPYNAVKIWASQRFTKIDDYAHDDPHATPGMIMHSETFLNASILQSIKDIHIHIPGDDGDGDHGENQHSYAAAYSYSVMEDVNICFLRVRADGAIWIEDCDASKSGFGGGYPGGQTAYTKLLTEFLPKGKTCRTRKLKDKVRNIYELACSSDKKKKKKKITTTRTSIIEGGRNKRPPRRE